MRSELVSFIAHYFRGSDKDYRLIISSCRAFIITAVAQLCVLGTTWIFGCFQFGNSPSAMSYVFTILNSLQGVLLFVMHCLLYKPVCTWFVFNYLRIYQNYLVPKQCVWICVYLKYLVNIQMQGGGIIRWVLHAALNYCSSYVFFFLSFFISPYRKTRLCDCRIQRIISQSLKCGPKSAWAAFFQICRTFTV